MDTSFLVAFLLRPSLPVSLAVSHVSLPTGVPTSVTPALLRATSDGPPAQKTLGWLTRCVLFVLCLLGALEAAFRKREEDVKSSQRLEETWQPLNDSNRVNGAFPGGLYCFETVECSLLLLKETPQCQFTFISALAFCF